MSMEAFIRKLERRVSTIKETPQNGVLGWESFVVRI
jgi:hypothetical protein